MPSILTEILTQKRREVQILEREGVSPLPDIDQPPPRDFKKAISHPGRIGLIAEIKFASPSAGSIREKGDPVPVGRIYEQAGAQAISLITDKTFFGGDLQQMPLLKKAVSLPLLRKDFIIHALQVWESLKFGADAILLIARILSRQQLGRLLALCRQIGIAALVEIHDRDDLHKALEAGAAIIGVNNRDLDTLAVDLQTTLDLIPLIPSGLVKVSESGIQGPADMHLLGDAGVQAVLVGTSLMKSENLLEKTWELVKAGKQVVRKSN